MLPYFHTPSTLLYLQKQFEEMVMDIRSALAVKSLKPIENTTKFAAYWTSPKFFAYVDVDGDGKVSMEEWVSTLGFIVGKVTPSTTGHQ